MSAPTLHDHRLNFSQLTGRNIKVAIVDSGIDVRHPRIGRVAGAVELAVNAKGRVISGLGTALRDAAGHGTACAGIVRRKASAAQLYSVRIFDESLAADGRLLVAAIRWAMEKKMDVVNMSLGTTDAGFREEIEAACREATAAGVILVAAEHNKGLESYPAALKEVIGVRSGTMSGPYEYHYLQGGASECRARGDAQRLCWKDRREAMLAGSSFAAPHITGMVALIREAHFRAPLDEVRRVLGENATRVEKPAKGVRRAHRKTAKSRTFAGISRAVLYPFTKEMHAFVRFRDLLGFEIAGIADPVGRGLVGQDAGEAIGAKALGVKIAARLERACEGADALVLGYVDQIGRISRRDVLRECVEMALERRMHVFSFLPLRPEEYGDLHRRAQRRRLRLHYPDVEAAALAQVLRQGPQGEAVKAPVLGVFGTSSAQGKFTLQLALRRRLQEKGYSVGQVGTEPHAELFGMDFCFPTGYASPLRIPLQYYPAFLDAQMRRIDARGPNIILVGSQSGTIPFDVHDPSTHTLPSLSFLLGTRPDACVLVVNSVDPEAYIGDTLDALRSVGKARVLALALSDKEKHPRAVLGRNFIGQRQMGAEQMQERLAQLEERFGLPAVAILSEAGQGRLVAEVVGHFSRARKQAGGWRRRA